MARAPPKGPIGRVETANVVVCGEVVVVDWGSHGTWTGPMDARSGESSGKRFQTRLRGGGARVGKNVRWRVYWTEPTCTATRVDASSVPDDGQRSSASHCSFRLRPAA